MQLRPLLSQLCRASPLAPVGWRALPAGSSASGLSHLGEEQNVCVTCRDKAACSQCDSGLSSVRVFRFVVFSDRRNHFSLFQSSLQCEIDLFAS